MPSQISSFNLEAKANPNAGMFTLLAARKTSDSQSLTITTENDDGEGYGTTDLYFNGESNDSLDYAGSYDSLPTFSFFRFTLSKSIPAGASITSATLSVYGTTSVGTWGSNSDYLVIQLNDSANASQVSAASQFPNGGGNFTTTVRWPSSGGLTWAIAGLNTTPNISSLVQTLVNKYGGLSAGSHIQVWIYSPQTGVRSEVELAEYGHANFNTHLNISWVR